MPKGWAAVEAETHVKTHVLLQLKKQSHEYQKYHDFGMEERIAQDFEVKESWKETRNSLNS